MLRAKGHVFATETDSEVIAHLVTEELKSRNSAVDAVAAALPQLKAHCARLPVRRRGRPADRRAPRSPLAVGYGDGEMYLGSDALALAPFTQDVSISAKATGSY